MLHGRLRRLQIISQICSENFIEKIIIVCHKLGMLYCIYLYHKHFLYNLYNV